jgi:hypothetical protein
MTKNHGICAKTATARAPSSLQRNSRYELKQGFIFLDQLTAAELNKFRGQWGNGPQTTRRKHERLIAFFWFYEAARKAWDGMRSHLAPRHGPSLAPAAIT